MEGADLNQEHVKKGEFDALVAGFIDEFGSIPYDSLNPVQKDLADQLKRYMDSKRTLN